MFGLSPCVNFYYVSNSRYITNKEISVIVENELHEMILVPEFDLLLIIFSYLGKCSLRNL